MIELHHRPTNKLILLISKIERLAGAWDRISENTALPIESIRRAAFPAGAVASANLDHDWKGRDSDAVALYERAREITFDLDLSSFAALSHAFGNERAKDQPIAFRTWQLDFESRASEGEPSIRGFRTLPPYVISQRLEQLLAWTKAELRIETHHPLIVIGTFHLLMLQIHPVPAANHQLSLFSTWRLLVDSGYSFVECSHLSPRFFRQRERYFNVLYQAEKTAAGNWSTLNIWLEYFLTTLLAGLVKLVASIDQQTDEKRLSAMQHRIVEVIRVHGPVSRDHIATSIGVSPSTVKYNLSVLARRGHVTRHGGGRGTNYSIA